MAEVEKLKDEALNEVSGGQKYNVGNIPISVHPYPNGPVLYVLTMGDYLVTDGQVIWFYIANEGLSILDATCKAS